MRPERRIVRRFIMTESRISHKLEGQFFGDVVQYALIKRAYAINKFLHKLFKLYGRVFFIFILFNIPIAVVVFGKLGKILKYKFFVHVFPLQNI